jgi:hypothetical protein
VSKKSKRATKKVSPRYKALESAAREIRKNSPIIRKKLRAAGVKPDPALVLVVAQYYRALNKLAKT